MADKAARSGADILAAHQPVLAEAVAHICLRPDLVDAWTQANEALIEAESQKAGNERLGSGTSPRAKELAQKVRDIEDEIAAHDLAFTFRGISKDRHSEICDEHPPRPDNNRDLMVGFNRQAVDNAVARECLVDPVFEDCTKKGCKHADCGSWQQFLAVCPPGEWDEIVTVVREVNGAVMKAPKSVLASRILDKGGSVSRRRARGA